MSASRLGVPKSEEHRRRISEAHKGKRLSEECKQKLRAANLGKSPTEETRRKMSQTWKLMKWWNDGAKNVRAAECPGGNYVRGRIKK